MMSLNPLLLVGGVIGTVSVLLLIAYACVKDKKTAMGFERSMADGEILRRLFGYAKPYLRQFVVVGFLVLFSISYDIASPLIVGYIEELVVGDFELKSLYVSVAVYAVCWSSRWPAPICRPSFCSVWASASSPICAKTFSPTLKASPTAS